MAKDIYEDTPEAIEKDVFNDVVLSPKEFGMKLLNRKKR